MGAATRSPGSTGRHGILAIQCLDRNPWKAATPGRSQSDNSVVAAGTVSHGLRRTSTESGRSVNPCAVYAYGRAWTSAESRCNQFVISRSARMGFVGPLPNREIGEANGGREPVRRSATPDRAFQVRWACEASGLRRGAARGCAARRDLRGQARAAKRSPARGLRRTRSC